MDTKVVEAALEEALEVLEEFPRPLTPSQAREALKPIARKAGAPRKTFTRRALEEARRWTEGVLDAFWDALGISSPPPEVGEALQKDGKVRLWCPWGRKAPLGKLTVETNQRGTFTYLDLPLSERFCPRTFLLEAHAGRVEVGISPRLFARKGRALFRTRDPRGIKKTLEEVGPFRPLFDAMGLPDLEKALEALSRLKNGEIRREGSYVLARKERLRVFKRGSYFGTYFGDPILDGRFLLGERVVLAYESGVEVILRGSFSGRLLSLKEASIRWGDEAVELEEAEFATTNALRKAAPTFLFQTLLGWNAEKVFLGRSPRMKALIAELAKAENPFVVLEDPEFFRKLYLRVLSDF
jgi:hypothetical protein